MNWVSDQYSQYGTKVASVREREALNSVGHYDLTAKPPRDGRLRPLRQAPIEAADDIPTPPLGVNGDKH